MATQVYLDGVLKFQSSTATADTTLPIAVGTHQIVIQGWDSSGAIVHSRHATRYQRTEETRFLAFPHKRVKAAAGFKAQAAIEFHGLGIGFSHGKAQAQEVAGAQLLRA